MHFAKGTGRKRLHRPARCRRRARPRARAGPAAVRPPRGHRRGRRAPTWGRGAGRRADRERPRRVPGRRLCGSASDMLTSAAATALASPAAIAEAGAPVGSRAAARRQWFMDYRNADGSVAEMCGNGVRVFARYLDRTRARRGPRARHRDPRRDPPGPRRGPTDGSPWTWARRRCSAPGGHRSAAGTRDGRAVRSATRTWPAWWTAGRRVRLVRTAASWIRCCSPTAPTSKWSG